jgi:hypothetical protein
MYPTICILIQGCTDISFGWTAHDILVVMIFEKQRMPVIGGATHVFFGVFDSVRKMEGKNLGAV